MATTFNSDGPVLFFLFVLSLFGVRYLPLRDLVHLSGFQRQKSELNGPFSVTQAILSYSQYEQLSQRELKRMRASYSKLGRAHKRTGYDLGYTKKLNRLEEVTASNAEVTRAIVGLAKTELGLEVDGEGWIGEGQSPRGDLGKVRETLRHFVRDWSDEGRPEREEIFAPILEVLKHASSPAAMKVLVPGSGLGRLAWEISRLGFDTTANEISSYMNLALRFLLSPTTTTTLDQHLIYPYAHWFSHSRSNDALFRPVSFPDVIPRLTPTFNLLERDFITLLPPLRSEGEVGYDYIVTMFFIDTSLNAIATIEQIYTLLRPGGTWVNLGPLLWSPGAQASLELNLEEVIAVAEGVGFVLGPIDASKKKTMTVDCEYTADRQAMMKWIYRAEFWVATKLT
ncbi:hypothetical protein JAAARDRAFT_208051 [Jaapia argillacea MUCL 33604]|uniref:Uncharacterized protein n=1 Tax=Jaapia argillacea MUCL 33604 TaxID=933084 RepID=A0A067PRB0_9AGAM|nr:hypothetical protein JAAARDRAFT_208051 [Jaapia argillacea MUCL 33604]